MDYKKMYLLLFNGITSALNELDRMNLGTAAEILKAVQCECEEMYVEAHD